ncbi:MAG: hypothetical protein CW691_00725 [Candidatus Bathyarchaeum sp.]|nr:MAG: hypothetical protein CW691_00725 [Candidatus Bathyarchaeum sp.]
MSSTTVKLAAIIVAVTIVFSAFNAYLILDRIQVQEQLDAQEEQINELQTALGQLIEQEERISELEIALDELGSQEEQISELQIALDATKDDVEGVSSTLSSLAAQLSSLNQSTATGLAEIETSLKTLAAVTSDLSDLELIVDQMLIQTPEQIYNYAYRSVVLITTPVGQGSGFLFENQNTVVTNYHVVTTQTEIEIEFFDGTRTPATVVGADAYSDVAVLEISGAPSEAEPLTFSDQSVEIGQQVVAIGNPLGLTTSLSVGYISQINRLLDIEPIVVPVLQLDLTVTFGSSGGPLLDLYGNVVGITNAGTDVGFNFAIPVDIVRRVVSSILEDGEYLHPFVGVSIVALTPDIVTILNVLNVDSYQTGLLVMAIFPGYPAEEAGLVPAVSTITPDGFAAYTAMDIILAVDGHSTLTIEDWSAYMEVEVSPGQSVTLTVWRSGETSSVTFTTTERPPYEG